MNFFAYKLHSDEKFIGREKIIHFFIIPDLEQLLKIHGWPNDRIDRLVSGLEQHFPNQMADLDFEKMDWTTDEIRTFVANLKQLMIQREKIDSVRRKLNFDE